MKGSILLSDYLLPNRNRSKNNNNSNSTTCFVLLAAKQGFMFCSITACFSFNILWGFVFWLQSRETQGLVPVTVKQISEASQSGDEKSNFVINGVDVTNVLFISCSFITF